VIAIGNPPIVTSGIDIAQFFGENMRLY